MPLRVVVIVDGHGEEEGAVRKLLDRIWYELLHGDYIEILPWRAKRDQLRKEELLQRVVEAAAIRLHGTQRVDFRRLLLIMTDSEGKECPALTGRQLVEWARLERSDPATEIACVVLNPMFETWFAAAAASLRGVNGLPDELPKPTDPEGEGIGKAWIKKHLKRKYKETVDQPRLVGHMNLAECRQSSRSFRKLCKELEIRLPAAASAAEPTSSLGQSPEQNPPEERIPTA